VAFYSSTVGFENADNFQHLWYRYKYSYVQKILFLQNRVKIHDVKQLFVSAESA